jgi:hypothetical protein
MQRLCNQYVVTQEKFHCPHCHRVINLKHYAAFIGAMGGKAKGPKKARTSEQARAAVNARWAKRKKAEADPTG